jgi:hypothetical protein
MAKVKMTNVSVHEGIRKKTSIGGNHSMIKTSSMNKSTRKSYKRYRGQGR